jgi:hypothetical protein
MDQLTMFDVASAAADETQCRPESRTQEPMTKKKQPAPVVSPDTDPHVERHVRKAVEQGIELYGRDMALRANHLDINADLVAEIAVALRAAAEEMRAESARAALLQAKAKKRSKPSKEDEVTPIVVNRKCPPTAQVLARKPMSPPGRRAAQ